MKIPNTLNLELTKKDIQELLNKAMSDEAIRNKLATTLSPLIQDMYPEFPTYNEKKITGINEDGTANVVLRIKKTRVKKEVTVPEVEQSISDA